MLRPSPIGLKFQKSQSRQRSNSTKVIFSIKFFHAVGMATVRPYGLKIGLVKNSFSASAARFFVIMVKFIINTFLCLDVSYKKYIESKNFKSGQKFRFAHDSCIISRCSGKGYVISTLNQLYLIGGILADYRWCKKYQKINLIDSHDK